MFPDLVKDNWFFLPIVQTHKPGVPWVPFLLSPRTSKPQQVLPASLAHHVRLRALPCLLGYQPNRSLSSLPGLLAVTFELTPVPSTAPYTLFSNVT